MLAVLALFTWESASAQLYFPPVTGNEWSSTNPSELGWCTDQIPSLYQYLESQNTKAFLVLKDGKMVIEKYFGTFTADSAWYWASAGKSLTAFLVGMAQQEGYFKISDSTSKYLGSGWTSCTPQQESAIQIVHQLSMTSGLDDGVPDHHCTLDTCLKYKADPGTRWAYHNGPYTLLDQVMESATGRKLNTYAAQKLQQSTGITGLFVKTGYNNVFFSRPRSMARFGLLMLNNGTWAQTHVMTDTSYFLSMIRPSQSLNKSYGYLWWLNGQESFMLPGVQFAFNGSFAPNAPEDMYAALGKNGQVLHVVPSQNLVLVRMGNAPDDAEVSVLLSDSIWKYLNRVICQTAGTWPFSKASTEIQISPNPAHGKVQLTGSGVDQLSHVNVFNLQGQRVYQQNAASEFIDLQELSGGVYWVELSLKDGSRQIQKLLIQN